jgi:AcrR family transcriptional regulator
MAEALRLFHRHGYHAVSMEDIGRAAGINASSVYRHFAGKADLLAAIYYRAAERVAAANRAALAAAADPDDALCRVVESYVDLVFTQGDLVSVYQAENNNLPERDRHELRKAQRLQVEEWVRLLVACRPPLTPAEARVLVHAALNLVTDIARLARFDRSRELVVADLAVTSLRRARDEC